MRAAQDDILTPWESMLNFEAYAVRIPRRDIHRLPDILRAIPADKVTAMQTALGQVWERFTYSSLAIAERERQCAREPEGRSCKELTTGLSGLGGKATGHDAIDTLMQVLQARMLTQHHRR